MSKSRLKKELQCFDREQLCQIILDAYDSSAQAKAYFEFFLNPDADALMDKTIQNIEKEFNRTKWGECKARISHVRKTIKEFVSFGVGPEKHTELLYNTVTIILRRAVYLKLTDPQLNGLKGFACEYVTIAARYDFLEDALVKMEKLLTKLARPRMKSFISDAINYTVKNLKPDIQ